MKFYTSDLHFDHSNMLEYEHRPWANVESMNEGLLYRINGRVRLDDELYILGDFTLRSTRSAVEKFRNGIICKHVHLITGNHDYFAKRAWASELFETIQPYKEIHDDGHKLILCHFPILYWNGMDDDGSIHLYGHMHSRKDMQHPHKDAYNVGVDVNDWYPVTLKELLERRRKMSLIKKYIDKFFDGERDVAVAFTLIYGILGIGIVICLALLVACIFVG